MTARAGKKVINLFLNILLFIFGVILLITIYNAIQVKVLKNDYSSFFGYSVFEVQTGSMEPKISAGDWVIVKYDNSFKLDDIITFKQGNDFITHRVVEAYKGTYVTRGDANNAKDNPISKDQVVGKVIKIVPNIGIVRNVIFNPWVLAFLIITIYFITLLFKKSEKPKKKKIKEVSEVIDIKPFKLFRKEKKEELEIETIETPESEEVANEEEIVDTIEAEDIVPSDEEDALDKTMYFRMVAVDETELDEETLKKLAKERKAEEKKEAAKKVKKDKKEKKTQKEEKAKESDLELLGSKKKKFKNIYEKVMFIKENELLEMINILEDNRTLVKNESSIRKELLKTYIDGKYYNYCGNINVEYTKKNMVSRLTKALQDKSIDLANSYNGSDKMYASKVDYYTSIFILLLHLESSFLVKEPISEKRDFYKAKILKYMKDSISESPLLKSKINELIAVQKKSLELIKEALEKLQTNMFALAFTDVNKDIKAANLKHNLNFSKVYSDYIVDKAYSEGIVAEDKFAVLLTLLAGEIVKDMLVGAFESKYLLYAPEELYAKSNKLSAIFTRCEDEYAKNSIVILVQYDELSKNSKQIKELVKEGFNFAVDLSRSTHIKTKDMRMVEMMSYIFAGGRTRDKREMITSLSDSAKQKVIYEDLEKKIGSYWG